MRRATPRERGNAAERQAEAYLQERGLRLVARNVSSRRGEIDLVMRDGRQLVFIEVRYRRSLAFGGAAASVTAEKQRRILTAATLFLQARQALNKFPCRFDVVAVSSKGVEWIADAFRPDWL